MPSFDLVVATIDRVEELGRLLASLEEQTYQAFRVLVVDQNEDDRLSGVLREHDTLDLLRFRAAPGLSRARNTALGAIRADVVTFPDDDCTFPPDLLERVAHRFAESDFLEGLTGRAADRYGRSSSSWSRDAIFLTRTNLWNRAISFTIFLRSSVVSSVGDFDERLGLGSAGPWSSGEETDYLVRALDRGSRIAYDPEVIVMHDLPALSAMTLRSIGARDGASIGYILRKHRYPRPYVARMLLRPAGGALIAAVRRDRTRVAFHLDTLRGRVLGYRHAVNAES
jgi:glycosyltransferase involved in cell wall biosynthesis